ncbi:alpha-1,3-mannosyltransferase, partial [Tremellales sp. Uapishka_1]
MAPCSEISSTTLGDSSDDEEYTSKRWNESSDAEMQWYREYGDYNENENDDESDASDSTLPPSSLRKEERAYFIIRDQMTTIVLAVGFIWMMGFFNAFRFPTTIPIFIGIAVSLTGWTLVNWCAALGAILFNISANSTAWPMRRRIGLAIATLVLLFWANLGLIPPAEEVPVIHRADINIQPKYFIAANLYENEIVFPSWSSELLKVAAHLGEENTYISIFESNSKDQTRPMLDKFRMKLVTRGIPHRIVSEDTEERWWPYATSPERIEYLARARNRALEPLQSPDESIRLPDYDSFTKIIFLNDIYYTWQSIIRLLATRLDGDPSMPADYDLACAMDFGSSGLYDTWVSRDVCGTPFRAFWPYAKDPHTVEKVKKEKAFAVATCWNGAVALPAGPYLYRPEEPVVETAVSPPRLQGRGWKMVDNSTYPNTRKSPPLSYPLQFRGSHIDACDHSECFLFSYDLHRIHSTPDRPPRIYMNPSVKVAYQANWFRWHTKILRIPVIKWWLGE